MLEGSTLGGQNVSRILEQRFGFHNGVGYSFFRGYGHRTGAMWRTFQEFLVSSASPQTETPMVRAAQATFSALYEWMASGLAVTPLQLSARP